MLRELGVQNFWPVEPEDEPVAVADRPAPEPVTAPTAAKRSA